MTNPYETLPNQPERPRRSGCLAHAVLVVAGIAFGCSAGCMATPVVIEKLWILGVYDDLSTPLKVAAALALLAAVLPLERTGRIVPAALALAAGAMIGNFVGFMSMQ